ncbi:MAG: HDOD domain-containing protein [Planctomycetes bacterium]|nr:HDOD domain-containing protein [Planctomycetota bacterium]
MDKLKEILGRVKEMPTMPAMADNALKILSDPNVHILKAAEALQQDFALTTRILKLANSAYYARGRKISTMLEALVLLGMKTIKNLLISASAYGIMNKKVEGYLLGKEDLWKHSLCCALASEIIAAETRPALKELAYTSGLLHDVGKIILAHYVQEDFIRLIEKIEKENVSFDTAENEIIGFSHATLGAGVLRQWNFSEEITMAIEFHHSPELSSKPDLARIVHIADAVSMMIGVGIGADGLMYPLDENAVLSLGLAKEKFEGILAKTADAVSSFESEI